MVERCSYCGLVHDVGEGRQLLGVVMKTCPQVPPDSITWSMVAPVDDDLEFFDANSVIDA